MDFIDGSYLNAVQNVHAPDYVGLYTRGYQVAQAMPWSQENVRKRQLEDLAISMRQQQFAAQQAQQAQEMQLKQALLPYQIARYQQLAKGGVAGTTNPVDAWSTINSLPENKPQAPGQPVATSPSVIPPLQPGNNINFDAPAL